MRQYCTYITIAFLSFMSFPLLAQMYALDSAFIRLSNDKEGIISLRYERLINTDKWEYSPIYYKSGIAYVGSRPDKHYFDFDNKTPFFTIKFAEKSGDGKLSLPRAFGVRNSPQLHEGPLAFNKDESIMYYTLSVPTEEGGNKVPLQIYKAKRGEEHWEDVGPLKFEKPELSYAHPSLNASNDILVFAAELEDSYGGMDLYISKKVDGEWTEPINLGEDVNSAGNELFPRFHKSGILFYASDGLNKGRDLDIFATAERNGIYVKPVRLKAPFNSEGDDFGLIMNKNGTSGYFNSNRKGTEGEDDILSFTSTIPLIPFVKEKMNLQIIVQDKNSRKRLKGVQVYLFDLDKNGLLADKELYETRFETVGDEIKIRLKLKDPSKFPPADYITDINGAVGINYTPQNPSVIVLYKEGYQVEQIEIDSIDSDQLTLMLQYVDCIPLQLKVFNKAGALIESEIRLMNECNGKQVQVKEISTGNYDACLQPDCYYMLVSNGEGYQKDTLIFISPRSADYSLQKSIVLEATASSSSSSEPTVKVEEKSIENMDKLEAGDVITLRKIYYDYNKSTIRAGAAVELDALAVLLKKYPDISIELNAHTDSRGSDDYNLKLSLQRALSAKHFLVDKGIDASRIQAVGYGESIPLNDCIDGVQCTEEEYQVNRRTEVRVLNSEELDIEAIDNKPVIIDKAGE